VQASIRSLIVQRR